MVPFAGRVKSAFLSAALLPGCLLLCLPACSTLTTVSRGEKYLAGGTRANIEAFAPSYSDDPWIGLRRFFSVFDFPFSLALDAVLLPVTIPLQLIQGDKPERVSLPPPDLEEPKK